MKVCTFEVGDIVTIDTNAARVEKLQRNHGEWVETMKNVNMEHEPERFRHGKFHIFCLLFTSLYVRP